MKLIFKVIFFCTLSIMVSCGEQQEFILKGELNNKKENTIYAIYDDPVAKIDTIKPEDGKFEYSFIPDTITTFRLVNDSGYAVPIFADKGWNVTFKGSFYRPEISGNGPNDDLQKFREMILKNSNANITDAAKQFILANRESYASAYIFNQYFIQGQNPDLEELADIVAQMDGHVKDCRIVDIIQKTLSDNKEAKSDYLNYYSCKDRKGKYVSWNSKDELYTLVNIWASWDERSKKDRDSLYSTIKTFPKKDFRVLNISLDFNRKEWESNCKDENEQWIEVCNFDGWQNPLVKQMRISNVPYNILVTKNRKIITTCISYDKIKDKINSLTEDNKNKK